MNDTTLKSHLTQRTTWLRALYMVLFALIYSVVELVILAVVLLQFAFVLFSGRSNQRLLRFGQTLSTYVYQILVFVTYNTEDKPFPFSPWPGAEGTNVEAEEPAPVAPEPASGVAEDTDQGQK